MALQTNIGGARITLDRDAQELRFEGRMTAPDPTAQLGLYLEEIHARVGRTRWRRLTVDLTHLLWASEAVVGAFVSWILAIEQSRPEQQYVVRFRIDFRSAWQTATFQALRSVAGTIVEIEPAPDGDQRG
jgi:hypothetical protein